VGNTLIELYAFLNGFVTGLNYLNDLIYEAYESGKIVKSFELI